jgi:hypothetical protein
MIAKTKTESATIVSSGNPTVDRVGQIARTSGFIGDLVPTSFYRHVGKMTAAGHWKTDYLAAQVLAHVFFRYRPKVVTDPETGVVHFYTYLKHEHLQLDTKELALRFYASDKMIRSALDLLESLGLIKRYRKDLFVNQRYTKFSAQFIAPVTSEIAKIVYDVNSETDAIAVGHMYEEIKRGSSSSNGIQMGIDLNAPVPKREGGGSHLGTHTKTTKKINVCVEPGNLSECSNQKKTIAAENGNDVPAEYDRNKDILFLEVNDNSKKSKPGNTDKGKSGSKSPPLKIVRFFERLKGLFGDGLSGDRTIIDFCEKYQEGCTDQVIDAIEEYAFRRDVFCPKQFVRAAILEGYQPRRKGKAAKQGGSQSWRDGKDMEGPRYLDAERTKEKLRESEASDGSPTSFAPEQLEAGKQLFQNRAKRVLREAGIELDTNHPDLLAVDGMSAFKRLKCKYGLG